MTTFNSWTSLLHTVHKFNVYVEIKCQLDETDDFLLHILLLAQHVSRTIMPIIRSSRVLYKPQLHTIPTTWKPKHQIPQVATTCIIISSSWWWA